MNLLKKIGVSFWLMMISLPAFAEEMAHATTQTADQSFLGFIAIGAGVGMGLAALGGAAGQGKAASAALDGIARNPSSTNKLFVPLLLSLALMESLVILTFLIGNGLVGTITKVLGLG